MGPPSQGPHLQATWIRAVSRHGGFKLSGGLIQGPWAHGPHSAYLGVFGAIRSKRHIGRGRSALALCSVISSQTCTPSMATPNASAKGNSLACQQQGPKKKSNKKIGPPSKSSFFLQTKKGHTSQSFEPGRAPARLRMVHLGHEAGGLFLSAGTYLRHTFPSAFASPKLYFVLTTAHILRT